MSFVKKLVLGSMAAVSLSLAAAGGYGAYIWHLADDPLYRPASSDPFSVQNALVEAIKGYKEDGVFLMPVAYGLGYQSELMNRARTHEGSRFKRYSIHQNCDGAPTTAGQVSGHAERFPVIGVTRDNKGFTNLSEPFKDDPTLAAIYLQPQGTQGFTILASSSPSLRHLFPEQLPAADGLSGPGALFVQPDCQVPAEMGPLVDELMAAADFRVTTADGREVVFTKEGESIFFYEGDASAQELVPLIYNQLVARAKGGGDGFASMAKVSGTDGDPQIQAYLLSDEGRQLTLIYNEQAGVAHLYLFASKKTRRTVTSQ